MNTVPGSKFQVLPDVEEDQTPTQKIWRPVAQLDQTHLQAFQDLKTAVSKGDEVAMKSAFDQITAIELEQRLAHIAARAYILAKVQNRAEKHG